MAKSLSQMNKGELVNEAKRLGVDVPGTGKREDYEALTVDDLRSKIQEAREEDSASTPAAERGAQPVQPPVGSGHRPNLSGGGNPDPNPSSGLHSGPGAGLAPDQEPPSDEEATEQFGAGLTADNDEDLAEQELDPEEAAAAGPLTVQQTRIRRRRATAASPEHTELVLTVANQLADLPFDALTRLQTAVSGALAGRGKEPEPEPVSELALARSLPRNGEAKAKVEIPAVLEAVKQDPNAPSGLRADDIMRYSVRQQQSVQGKGIGPMYAVVALTDGRKLAGRL